MSLQRYAREAEARADALADLIDQDETKELWKWCQIKGNVDWMYIMYVPSDEALKVIGMQPKQRLRWVEKRRLQGDLWPHWIAARWWAVWSAKALNVAADLEDVPGLSYRKACQSGAQAARKHLDPMSPVVAVWFLFRDPPPIPGGTLEEHLAML